MACVVTTRDLRGARGTFLAKWGEESSGSKASLCQQPLVG